MNTATHSSRYSGLDGLRGIACLMVFGVHFQQVTRLSGEFGPFDLERTLVNGNTGVAIFFVLSGFLLSLPFWRGHGPGVGAGRYMYFLARRASRILPAYYVCLTALVVINGHWRSPDAMNHLPLHYALIFNFWADRVFAINPPFWTLAVEAQFYLLLPLFFAVIRLLPHAARGWGLAAFAGSAYVLHWTFSSQWQGITGAAGVLPPSVSHSLLAHLPHFLCGCIAGGAFVARERASCSAWKSDAVAWACSIAIAGVISTSLDDVLTVPYGRYNFPVLTVLIGLLVLSVPSARSMRWLLGTWPLRSLGVVSYGVYIYHMPIQNVTARYMYAAGLAPQNQWVLFGSVSLVLTLCVAAVSYLLFERYIVAWVRRSSGTGNG